MSYNHTNYKKMIREYKEYNHVNEKKPLLFQYDFKSYTSFSLFFCEEFNVEGIIAGGNPAGRLFVSIFRIGSFHFSKEEVVFASYVEEKLGLCLEDAEELADIINFWNETSA